MKRLKQHNSLSTLSIFRFNAIRESISNGNPEYGHLLVLDKYEDPPKLTPKQTKELEKHYIQLITELPKLNTELISSYRVYYESYIKTKIQIAKSKINELKSLSEFKVKFADLNRAFKEYIDVLNKNNTDFNILEYYIVPNIKEVFKSNFPNLEYPKEFDLIAERIEAFHNSDRYEYEIRNLPVNDYHREIFKSSTFLETFIKTKIQKIDDINLYVDRLSEDFKLNNNYLGFIDFRHKVLGLDVIDCRPYYEYSFYEEVASLKKILGFDFDLHNTSVLEYYAFIKSVEARPDKENKKKDKSA